MTTKLSSEERPPGMSEAAAVILYHVREMQRVSDDRISRHEERFSKAFESLRAEIARERAEQRAEVEPLKEFKARAHGAYAAIALVAGAAGCIGALLGRLLK